MSQLSDSTQIATSALSVGHVPVCKFFAYAITCQQLKLAAAQEHKHSGCMRVHIFSQVFIFHAVCAVVQYNKFCYTAVRYTGELPSVNHDDMLRLMRLSDKFQVKNCPAACARRCVWGSAQYCCQHAFFPGLHIRDNFHTFEQLLGQIFKILGTDSGPEFVRLPSSSAMSETQFLALKLSFAIGCF